MSSFLMLEPMTIAAIATSRGTGAANLKTRDPKEVWADTATGSATITIDLGQVRTIDTIFLGYVAAPVAEATWSITGGAANAGEITIQAAAALRVSDDQDDFAVRSHALFFGAAVTVRYLAIAVSQPAGAELTIGALLIGKALVTELGQEWGSGHRPIDTGSATALASGGFAVVDGARKRSLSWTFGDLSIDEAARLERLALALGETSPCLVVESVERTTGLRGRIFYGLFEKWRPYERRNRKQTRWEIGIEEWV